MKTKTIGEILKEERLFHRLSVEELARRTRIRPSYLEALENNQFDQLPAAAFVKGYIKTYAQVFGFDPQPLLGILRRDFKESAKGQLVPREFIKPLLRRQRPWTSVTWLMMGLVSIFVTVLLYVGVQWYNLNQPPKLIVTSPAENAEVAAQVEVAGETSPEAIVSVNNQPVALQPDGSFKTEIFLPQEGVASLTVEAKDRRGKTNLIQRTVYVRF